MAVYANQTVAVWQEGTVFAVTAGSGKTLITDGESQAGQGPMEMVLSGLAGCSGADVIDILRKKRQEVTALEVKVRGERREEHPRVYTKIDLVFIVTGRKIEAEAVRRAVELSELKYCSVSAMLRATAELVCRYEIREADSIAA